MIQRSLNRSIYKQASSFPFIAVTGPRQSSKTTLVQELFDSYRYINLEQHDMRSFAQEDPRGFINSYSSEVIFDEIQHVPNLLSWLQVHSDQRNKPGEFVLTGSQNFMLMEKISQSLAGRIAIHHLLPLSFSELKQDDSHSDLTWQTFMFSGGYPRIYKMNIDPTDFYPSYEMTYIERDVRQISSIGDLNTFRSFLKLLAGRIGNELNLSSIASDVGVSYKTIQHWISILEASFVVFRLPPFYKNFNKRLIKSPKIYFYDTGLACHLLGIRSESDLMLHFARGELFENMVILEVMKYFLNSGDFRQLYFWKDSNKNEVDLLFEDQNSVFAVEIKSAQTFNSDFFKSLNYIKKVIPEVKPMLVYGGDDSYIRNEIQISSMTELPGLLPAI